MTSYRTHAGAWPRPGRAEQGTPFYVGLAAIRRRRRRPPPTIGGALLIAAGLTTLVVKALARRAPATPRMVGLGLALLALTGLTAFSVAVPLGGMPLPHIPGERTLHRLLNRLPQPWKPPRPAHVALPDVPHEGAAALAVTSPDASGAEARVGATPAAGVTGGDAASGAQPTAAGNGGRGPEPGP
ncbi:MAG: hypothetical protein ACRDI2_08085, partial [Chloroflexota bacterium]